MKRYQHGLVIGKFYPPHAGHHYLVSVAAEQCEQVTVLVMAAQVETIPLADRIAWMTEVHRLTPNVTVIGVRCDCPMDMDSGPIWTAQVAVMKAALTHHERPPVDAVFSSEKYGDELADRLGAATHVPVDPERVLIPISGTACRADLPQMWPYLAAPVKAGLATRIIVVGAESTGTTTVSRALAAHFRAKGGVWADTGWVPEFGRDYTVIKWDAAKAQARNAGQPEPSMDDLVWTSEDFRVIAERQNDLENAAAAAGSPLLVCDTDAFATSVWEYRYLGAHSHGADRAAASVSRRDVYLLTDHVGVPFVQDGIRDGEHIRADMTDWFVRALTAAGHSWVLLTGSLEQRLDLAIRCTEQMLAHRAAFGRPLG